MPIQAPLGMADEVTSLSVRRSRPAPMDSGRLWSCPRNYSVELPAMALERTMDNIELLATFERHEQ